VTASRPSSSATTGVSAWRLAGLGALCDLLDHPGNGTRLVLSQWRHNCCVTSQGPPESGLAWAFVGNHDPCAAGRASVSAWSSAETSPASAASAAPIRWKISSA